MPNSVTMIKRSSLILISSAAEAHFFVPEYYLTDIIYNTNMDSRKSCSTHSFLSFVFGCLQGSELTAGTFLYILYKRGVLEMNYADRTRIFKLRKEDANENAKRIHR